MTADAWKDDVETCEAAGLSNADWDEGGGYRPEAVADALRLSVQAQLAERPRQRDAPADQVAGLRQLLAARKMVDDHRHVFPVLDVLPLANDYLDVGGQSFIRPMWYRSVQITPSWRVVFP